MIKIKVENLGRDKLNFIAEVKDMQEAYEEVDQHLYSFNTHISKVEDKLYYVFAGFRKVGTIKIIN